MARRAVLHIGVMKTGSSAVQAYLHERVDAYRAIGIHYPQSSLGRNMSRLAPIARALAAGEAMTPADRERHDAFRDEMAALDEGVHTVVLSGEMLGESLDADAIAALKAMLDSWFGEIAVVVYLRRQDELALSRHSTLLRRGGRLTVPFARAPDYHWMLNRWARVFGRRAMRVRVYERSTLKNADIVEDLLEAAGLPYLARERPVRDVNPSLGPAAQAVWGRLALRMRERGYTGRLIDMHGHGEMDAALETRFAGIGRRPARGDVERFLRKVAASNERVRIGWFPERERLFSDVFSMYPVTADPEPDAAAVLDAALEALAAVCAAPPLIDPIKATADESGSDESEA